MDLHESTAGAAGAANDTGLDPRTWIRIDLFLARRRAGPGATTLKILALRERGRASGMNGAEMMANEAGDSHDAKASACLAYVAALVAHPGAPPLDTLRRMHDAGFRPSDIDQVTGRVAADAEAYRDNRRTP